MCERAAGQRRAAENAVSIGWRLLKYSERGSASPLYLFQSELYYKHWATVNCARSIARERNTEHK